MQSNIMPFDFLVKKSNSLSSKIYSEAVLSEKQENETNKTEVKVVNPMPETPEIKKPQEEQVVATGIIQIILPNKLA